MTLRCFQIMLARLCAERLEAAALRGCMSPRSVRSTCAQAVQMVKVALKSARRPLRPQGRCSMPNLSEHTDPDDSLDPVKQRLGAPRQARPQAAALLRADQIRLRPKARTARTGSRRLSPTPRPASAARWTRRADVVLHPGRVVGVHFEDSSPRSEKKRGDRGGQGAPADEPIRPHPRRGAPRRGRARRPHRPRGAHQRPVTPAHR